jgi:hypothetical protein
MSGLIAEFTSAQAVGAAATAIEGRGFALRDALTPYPLPKVDSLIASSRLRLRGPMAIAGFGTALFAFAFQTWTAVYAYPFNSGGRPLFSWPIFVLVPFEVGVLAAGLAGFIAFLVTCGFPRLNQPIFDIGGIESATQDRFFLVFERPQNDSLQELNLLLMQAGAISVSETSA